MLRPCYIANASLNLVAKTLQLTCSEDTALKTVKCGRAEIFLSDIFHAPNQFCIQTTFLATQFFLVIEAEVVINKNYTSQKSLAYIEVLFTATPAF